MPIETDFYFDYISPYSYIAWVKARRWEAEGLWKLRAKPVLFAGLLKRWGQLGPAEIPPKRIFTFRHCIRLAAEEGVSLRGPVTHPFNPLLALRATLACPEANRNTLVDLLFSAIWSEGIEGASRDALAQTLVGVGGDSLLIAGAEPEIKDALVAETRQAGDRGVFGVPTVFVNDELFWGQDGLDHARLLLEGNDPLDETVASKLLDRPQGQRPR